jgi:hypothetical protein
MIEDEPQAEELFEIMKSNETNNEPAAHFYPEGEGCTVFSSDFVFKYQGTKEPIPLYTHPANPKYDPETGEPLIDGYPLFSGLPPKTLTISDRDILKIIHDNFTKFGFEADYIVEDTELIDFARAILRKAQEK